MTLPQSPEEIWAKIVRVMPDQTEPYALAILLVFVAAVLFGVRALVHHSDEKYDHPVFLNWINLALLAGWAAAWWWSREETHDSTLAFGMPVLLLIGTLAYNVKRTNIALGLPVTILQVVTVVPLALFVAFWLLPLMVLIFVARLADPQQREHAPSGPDSPHSRRLRGIYESMYPTNGVPTTPLPGERPRHRRH